MIKRRPRRPPELLVLEWHPLDPEKHVKAAQKWASEQSIRDLFILKFFGWEKGREVIDSLKGNKRNRRSVVKKVLEAEDDLKNKIENFSDQFAKGLVGFFSIIH